MEIKLDGVEGSLVLIKQGAEAEARCMTKARKLGVSTPVLYAVDPLLHTLTFEFVEGQAVKDILLDFGLQGIVEERLNDIATQIGDAIGKLHDGGLVHGDLTTSNMLIRNSTNQLVLIDFGLSFTSTLPEDKAVDLYVSRKSTAINALFMWKCDGQNPSGIQEILKAVVLNFEQASPSATKRKKTHNGWLSSSTIYSGPRDVLEGLQALVGLVTLMFLALFFKTKDRSCLLRIMCSLCIVHMIMNLDASLFLFQVVPVREVMGDSNFSALRQERFLKWLEVLPARRAPHPSGYAPNA
ncbi:EKC/KEOPS complex subunit [Sesamum angolense]|uniref:non-specific serine/threonine protein kinase n=1 Tax=Sesamum angolense TaxID=2727404 RepID=A0AAE1WZP5_9LAMI|nr:EKC/KEOPS complex subunit [Sesamum angolense]